VSLFKKNIEKHPSIDLNTVMMITEKKDFYRNQKYYNRFMAIHLLKGRHQKESFTFEKEIFSAGYIYFDRQIHKQ
jgi:hypothetical protein